MINLEKCAVLSTSDVQSYDYITDECQSYGTLEYLLNNGYTVLVVSIRSKLGKHDEWWLELVDDDNVYMPENPDPNVFFTQMIQIWKAVFKRLEQPPMIFEHWTNYRLFLADNTKILIGAALRKFTAEHPAARRRKM